MTLKIYPDDVEIGRGGRGITIEYDGKSVGLEEDEYPFYYTLIESVEKVKDGEKAWMYGLFGSRLLFTIDESDSVCIRHLFTEEEFEKQECIIKTSSSINVPLEKLVEATRNVCEQALEADDPDDQRNQNWKNKISKNFNISDI